MSWRAAIAALLALLLGFLLGRGSAPRPDTETATVASLQWALEEKDWLTRTRRYSAFLDELGPQSLPDALGVFERHLPWLTTDELRLFMMAWSRFDPGGALRHTRGLPAPFHRNAGGAAVYAWAFRDPAAAQAALETVEDEELRDFMRGRLIAGWIHRGHSPEIDAYIASLPEGSRRLGYIGKVAWEISREGPGAVMRWAEGTPGTDLQYKAAVFLKASIILARVHPETAAEWISRHRHEPYAPAAIGFVAHTWARRDPVAAMDWLLEEGPPEAPIDTELRRQLVAQVGRAWLRREPAAARAWLERSPLPAAEQQAILADGTPQRATGAAVPEGTAATGFETLTSPP